MAEKLNERSNEMWHNGILLNNVIMKYVMNNEKESNVSIMSK